MKICKLCCDCRSPIIYTFQTILSSERKFVKSLAVDGIAGINNLKMLLIPKIYIYIHIHTYMLNFKKLKLIPFKRSIITVKT